MQRTTRRALPALVAVGVLGLAGCGGAGYGEPIAATDGDATVALAPAPATTPSGASTATTTTAPAATAATTATSTPSTPAAPSDAGGASTAGTSGSGGGSTGSSAGSGGGTDTLAAYAIDANRFCSGFKGATGELSTTIGAAGQDTRAIGRAAIAYGSAITSAATGLRAAPVPAEVRTYHRRTLAWVSGVTGAISQNRSGLAAGEPSAGATVLRRVQALGAPPLGSAVPAALRIRAAACGS